VNAKIYLEGGAKDSNQLRTRCQEAFNKLLKSMGFGGRMPRLIACGGRQDAFDRFCTAIQTTSGYVAMWIDSEDPMADIERTWDHLATVTTVRPFEKPQDVNDDQVLMMTTCMESWISADHATLLVHFGKGFQENALPSLTNLESRGRRDVQDRLVRASRNCQAAYKKGEVSYEIVGKLNPVALRPHLPSFTRVERILTEKL